MQAANPELIRQLKMMVKGSYDLQALRMQAGLRLCANFRAKLAGGNEEKYDGDEGTEQPALSDSDPFPEARDEEDEINDEGLQIIKQLKASYNRLTDGVARNRTIPTEKGFKGDELISEYTEIMLVDQYIQLERQEKAQFGQLVHTLRKIPIYTEYLEHVIGIGPALAAVLITYFDPAKARNVSGFWMYAGLDVAPDGAGRSRRKEHLILRSYTDKNGNPAERLSTTYNPWLKMKLLGGLGPSFLRSGSSWRTNFDNYKHRLNTDPERVKVTSVQWKKMRGDYLKQVAAGTMTQEFMDREMRTLWTPGRIKNAALRYMVKMFLQDFWLKWRALEGLEVTEPYYIAKLGMRPHDMSKIRNEPRQAAE